MGWIALAFLFGVGGIHLLDELPHAGWSAALFAASAIAICMRQWACCAFLAGLAWAWGAAAMQIADDLPASLEGVDVDVAGYIASLPDAIQDDPQFLLDVSDAPADVPSRIRLAWYRAPTTPRVGELWRFTVRLKRRNGFANPGGFDYEGHLFREGVGATGYVREDGVNQRVARAEHRYFIDQLRERIADRIEAALGRTPTLGVIQGLAIGDTHAMTPEQWRVFAATGTTHLMAISGLHISMIAALAAWAGGAIVRVRSAQARGWSAMHGQVIAGGAAALIYSMLAGLSIPTQRTLIMLCIYFAARWLRSNICVAHALGLSLIGVLIVDPFAPLNIGAWLSFGAVAVILLTVSGRLARDGAIRSFSRVQLALTIGLTPLLLGAFGSLSLISPLANAIAVPLFTLLIVPLILLGAVAAALSTTIGAWVLSAPDALLSIAWPALEWFARQPFALVHFPAPTFPTFAGLAIGTLLLVAPGIWPMRVVGVLLSAPFILDRPAPPAVGDFTLAVLDVGQGLASVVRTHSHVLVYDAGPSFQTGRDTGELVLAPYLRARGVRAIDLLMISHGHQDHEGGARSVTAELPVRTTRRGPSVEALQGEVCARGQRWIWDDVTFTVLHPTKADAAADNDSSCVLEIRGRGGSALLTGDIEADAEAELVRGGLSPVDVVVAPHHGSRTSSTVMFVSELQPRLAVFSAGYRNRWNFPRADVVERWRTAGAQTLTTAQSGAVEVASSAQTPMHIREHRKAERRYWRR